MSEREPPIYARYHNGLERTGVGTPELFLMGALRVRGLRMMHAKISWHEGPTFSQLREREVEQTEQGLRKYGRYTLIGASAGASLTLNTFCEVVRRNPEADLYALLLSGWLQVGEPGELEHAALVRPSEGPSPAFVESVESINTEDLTTAQRLRIVHAIPADDQRVPVEYMFKDGIAVQRTSARDHVRGIAGGLWRAPGIIRDLHQ